MKRLSSGGPGPGGRVKITLPTQLLLSNVLGDEDGPYIVSVKEGRKEGRKQEYGCLEARTTAERSAMHGAN
jgi:hypothetical protein